jgi:hypothetical protein
MNLTLNRSKTLEKVIPTCLIFDLCKFCDAVKAEEQVAQRACQHTEANWKLEAAEVQNPVARGWRED